MVALGRAGPSRLRVLGPLLEQRGPAQPGR